MGYASAVKNMNKNDEWGTPRHAVEIILPYVPAGATVWCPFDLQHSQYKQVFDGGVNRSFIPTSQRARISFCGSRSSTMTALSATRRTAKKTQYLNGFLRWGNRGLCWFRRMACLIAKPGFPCSAIMASSCLCRTDAQSLLHRTAAKHSRRRFRPCMPAGTFCRKQFVLKGNCRYRTATVYGDRKGEQHA